MNYYWKKFWCIDDDVEIAGNYNSAKVTHLQLHLVKCDPAERSTCKSDEEI